jgi:hypothetical protein
MQNQQATQFLTHLKVAILKFESAYDLMTQARAEIHAVASNFKLDAVELPQGTLTADPTVDSSDEPSFEVAIWRNDTGSKLKATGMIDGSNFRLLFFESTKEGIVLSGSIVPKDAPEGSELKDISLGYVLVKPNDQGGHELSIKFDQFDFWFNGAVLPNPNASGNPKAPTFKAIMHKSGGGGGSRVKNAFASLMETITLPPAAIPDPVAAIEEFPVDTNQVPVTAPAAPRPTLFEMAPADPAAAIFGMAPTTPAPAAPTPPAPAGNSLFGSAVSELPGLQLPNWMTSGD